LFGSKEGMLLLSKKMGVYRYGTTKTNGKNNDFYLIKEAFKIYKTELNRY